MNKKMVYSEKHRFIFCINDYSLQLDTFNYNKYASNLIVFISEIIYHLEFRLFDSLVISRETSFKVRILIIVFMHDIKLIIIVIRVNN